MAFPLIEFDLNLISLERAQRDYDQTWATMKACWPHLSDEDVRGLISFMVDICPNCHNADSRCQCANDD